MGWEHAFTGVGAVLEFMEDRPGSPKVNEHSMDILECINIWRVVAIEQSA